MKGDQEGQSTLSYSQGQKALGDWKRKTVATIYAQGCENIISPTYVPTTSDEMLLIKKQSKFMQNVFITVIKTNMGQHFA